MVSVAGEVLVVLVMLGGDVSAEIEVAGVGVVRVVGLVGGSGHFTVTSKVSLKAPVTGFG